MSDHNNIRRRLRKIIAIVFELEESNLPDQPSSQNVSGWDSLGHIGLILQVEDEFGIRFETEAIPTLFSMDLLADEIERVQQSQALR